MGKGIVFVCLLAAVAIVGASSGPATATSSGGSGAMVPSSAASAPTIVKAGDVKWGPVKGFSGAEFGVLWGDPTKAGKQYAVRYRFADGFAFPPHTHPKDEQVTVLSGTLLVGVGKTVDATKMIALPAGSFVAIPANLPHYAKAQGEVIIELHGVGPYATNMIK